MIDPMTFLNKEIIQRTEEKKLFKKAPMFAPAGQSTQVIIGATPENDNQILHTANHFYKNFNLKRFIILAIYLFWRISVCRH